jgi:hypothetical protein
MIIRKLSISGAQDIGLLGFCHEEDITIDSVNCPYGISRGAAN